MGLVGQIGSSIVIVDDMGKASEDSRVEPEGIRTWVVEHRTHVVVDRRHMQAAADKRHRVVNNLQVAVGRRQTAACCDQGVAEGSHSPVEAYHWHALAACRRQKPVAVVVNRDPPDSPPGLAQRSCSSHQPKIGSNRLAVAAGRLADLVRAVVPHIQVAAIASLTTPQLQSFKD